MLNGAYGALNNPYYAVELLWGKVSAEWAQNSKV